MLVSKLVSVTLSILDIGVGAGVDADVAMPLVPTPMSVLVSMLFSVLASMLV